MNVNIPNIEEEGIESNVIALQFEPKATIGDIKEHLSTILKGNIVHEMKEYLINV